MKKKLRFLLLALVLLLGTTGCTAKDSAPNGETADNSQTNQEQTESKEDAKNQTEEISAENLTLEDGIARLIYRDGNYLSVAYRGPSEISNTFVSSDGEILDESADWYSPHNGWWIFVSRNIPEDLPTDQILLSVIDYFGEKDENGRYVSKTYPLTESITQENIEAAGLNTLNGHICKINGYRPSYVEDLFVASLYIGFLDDCHDKNLDQIDGLADNIQFFAEDGKPLEDCFDGYTAKREDYWNDGHTISLVFYNNDYDASSSSTQLDEIEEKNKEMCTVLRELKPYALYTAADGSTQEFMFFE